ncbi:MAG: hypothetical protein NVS9B14_11070 [Candidatus Acidiferrum sp.]
MTNRNWRILRYVSLAAAFAGISLASQSLSAIPHPPQAKAESAAAEHEIYGTIRAVQGSTLTLETRAKKTIQVETKAANESQRAVILVVGHAVLVRGTTDAKGVVHASSIQRAKTSSALWPEDK